MRDAKSRDQVMIVQFRFDMAIWQTSGCHLDGSSGGDHHHHHPSSSSKTVKRSGIVFLVALVMMSPISMISQPNFEVECYYLWTRICKFQFQMRDSEF